MEAMEKIKTNIESSEEAMVKLLLEKYPDKIKNVETFDPIEISVEGVPIFEIETMFKERITDEAERSLAQLCLDYLHRPTIQDTFENNVPERREFIKTVTDNGSNIKLQELFDSNKMKVSHIRRICQLVYLIGRVMEKLPEDIVYHSEILNTITKTDETGYSNMSDKDKLLKIEEANELAKEIVKNLIDKYKLEKAA